MATPEALESNLSTIAKGAAQCRFATISGSTVDLGTYFSPSAGALGNVASFYAACMTVCDKARSEYLLLGNDDWIKIACNGSIVYTSKKTHSGVLPKCLIKLSLRKGINLVAIEVTNLAGTTGYSLVSYRTLNEALYESLRRSNTLMEKATVRGDLPKLAIDTDLPEASVMASVVRLDGGMVVLPHQVVNHGAICGDSALHGPGVYKLICSVGDRSIEQTFTCGKENEIFRRTLDEVLQNKPDAGAKMLADGLERRMKVLEQFENRKPLDLNWQLKVVNAIEDVTYLKNDLVSSLDPLRARSGIHIRPFRSDIDGSVQYYRIYWPTNSDRGRVPLFVIFPTVVSAARPFIDSPFIAAHESALNMARIAQDCGAAILWIGYREQPCGSPCDLTHFDEVLHDVSKHFPIDRTRIALFGSCAGGILADMTAVNWPHRFSCIGYENPLFTRHSVSLKPTLDFSGFPDYESWLQATDPESRIMHYGKLFIPLFVIHKDEEMPTGGSLTLSREFVDSARAHGVSISFRRLPHAFGRVEDWDVLFKWAVRQRNESASEEPGGTIIHGDDSVGPISFAFASGVVVAEPTLGTSEELAGAKRALEGIRSSWRDTHFAECPIKLDRDIDENDLKTKNIVIVGNPKTNALYRRWSTVLPIRITDDDITVDGHVWHGDDLGIQAVCRNPAATNRLIVVIGAPSMKKAVFPLTTLAVEGWFEYAVWQFTGGEADLVTARRYASIGAVPLVSSTTSRKQDLQ